MNLRTVVIIALLAFAGYRFIPPAAKSLDRSLGKAAGEEDSEPVREVSHAELATLHGRVEATEKDAVVIRCTTNTEFRVNRTADAASRLEFQTYGPLMEMSSAGLRR